MHKTKKIIIITVIFALLSVLFVSIPVSASSNVYTIDFQKPAVNDYSGYLEVLCENSQGKRAVWIQTWTYSGAYGSLTSGDGKIPLSVKGTLNVTGNKLSLVLQCPDSSPISDIIYTWIRSDTNVYDVWIIDKDPSNRTNINFYIEDGWTVKSIKGYGNVSYNHIDNGINDFTVVYGENSAIYNILKGVEIASNNQTNELKANDDKNTQSIIDNQNQLAQNEKNETQTQGQSSVDDLSGAVEDKSSGFVNSIRSLVSAMSYNGTECAWTLPEVKLPAINGVMAETKIIDSQPIDFTYWVNKIPSNILLVVRSVLTIGLIVYCFKELYSTISYVLTLKGGGDSE